MKVADIASLRPAEGADSATITAALTAASTERKRQAGLQAAAEAVRCDVMAADDRALLTAGREAAAARLAIERLDHVLGLLRADLRAALGAETIAALRAEAAGLADLAEAMRRWQRNEYPLLADAISFGLHAERQVTSAIAAFGLRVEAEYRREEVRAHGPLGINLPTLDGVRPTQIFPNWVHRVTVHG